MICLNMIVKNEAKVITRCLASVKPLVGAWTIVDTGSTDGTQDIVREAMRGVPGELYERPWRNFGYNRSSAIQLARAHTQPGDYLLVIDADDELEIAPHLDRAPRLTKDAYELRVEDAGISYQRIHLFRADMDFHYEGVLHEALTTPPGSSRGQLDGIVYRRTGGGARSSDPNKYRRDAEILAEALEADPNNARHAFYLAQSWRDAGEIEKSIAAYERRVRMGGWEEEVYFSLHQIARLTARLGRGDDAVMAAYLTAYEFRPTRAEPLCDLAMYLRARGRSRAAYPFARAAKETVRPDDILFVEDAVYAWRALDEFAIAAYWTDQREQARFANECLLYGGKLPQNERERVEKNLAFCLSPKA